MTPIVAKSIDFSILYTMVDVLSWKELAAESGGTYRTAQAMVAGALRKAILEGRLEVGRQLKQDAIATQFGVSKIPVREALKQLEGEGLVTVRPHHSAEVSSIRYEEAIELVEMRVALEPLALGLAVPRITEEDLLGAAKVLDRAELDLEQGGVGEYDALNWQFHRALLAPADRPRLLATIEALHTSFQRYLRVYAALLFDVKERAQREHRHILELCRRRETDGAVKALEKHLREVLRTAPKSLAEEDKAANDPG